LRALIKLIVKAWNLLLSHAKFAYNNAPSRTTGMPLFKVFYGVDPLSALDLVHRNSKEKLSVEASKRVEEIQKLHK